MTQEPLIPPADNPPADPPADKPADPPGTTLFDAPADIAEDRATGYAVYDRTLGRYVGGVTRTKPSASEARGAVVKGHSYKTVRV